MRHIFSRLIIILTLSLLFVGFAPIFVGAIDVNNFSFSSFEADYYLSKDSEGRSTMRVVEQLTAEFNTKDQNKGMERAIPLSYDGHPLSFKFESLTRNGQPEPIYKQRFVDGIAIIATGTEDYLNGTQHYVFSYTLRDVTKTFGDYQELYWDTNGTGWGQRFDELNVRVHLDNSLLSAFTGKIWCYEGPEGSSVKCPGVNNNGVISFKSSRPLDAYENVTVNLIFVAGTFAGYKSPIIADAASFTFPGIAMILFVVLLVLRYRFGRDKSGKGTIIPEYLPPKGASVLFSAEISNNTSTSYAAQIIDLAVRKKLEIIESESEKDFFGNKHTEYSVELINVKGLVGEELEFVNILFEGTQIGSKYTFNESDQSRSMELTKFDESLKKETENLGYRILAPKSILLIHFCFVFFMSLMIFIEVTFAAFEILMNNFSNTIGIIVHLLPFVLIMISFFIPKIYDMRPLTTVGRELFDYLKGLKMYIKLAEVDRLKILQSPHGANKKTIDTNDGSKVVVLYERLLPYAILFGQEKEWLKQLGTYYEVNNVSPGWYSCVNGFNATTFASSVGGFSSYSNSSSFSSSSGGGGGGSSGGGGGGGGGGGR